MAAFAIRHYRCRRRTRTVRFLTSEESDGDDDFYRARSAQNGRLQSQQTVVWGLVLIRVNTFESFVVGPNNQMRARRLSGRGTSACAHLQPALHLRRRRAGQTHLMQAIGQYLWAKKKTSKVMYLSSELFINEFIDAIQHNTLGEIPQALPARQICP